MADGTPDPEELLKKIRLLEAKNDSLRVRLRATQENLLIEQQEVDRLKNHRNMILRQGDRIKREAYQNGLRKGREEKK